MPANSKFGKNKFLSYTVIKPKISLFTRACYKNFYIKILILKNNFVNAF